MKRYYFSHSYLIPIWTYTLTSIFRTAAELDKPLANEPRLFVRPVVMASAGRLAPVVPLEYVGPGQGRRARLRKLFAIYVRPSLAIPTSLRKFVSVLLLPSRAALGQRLFVSLETAPILRSRPPVAKAKARLFRHLAPTPSQPPRLLGPRQSVVKLLVRPKGRNTSR